MNRPSTTNGQPATPAQGGYDAYFGQVEQAAETPAGTPDPTADPAAAAAPSPSAGRESVRSASDAARPAADMAGTPFDPVRPPGSAHAPSGSASITPAFEPLGSASARTLPADPAPDQVAGPAVPGHPGAGSPAAGRTSAEIGGSWDSAGTATPEVARPNATPAAGRTEQADRRPPVDSKGNRANTDVSYVPDRIARTNYDTHRNAVLPPALASPDLLADIAAVRQAHLRSNSGVRGALNKVGFNFGLSPAEQRAEERRSRIRRQLVAPYQIAVISVKGGVGRTTTVAALGSTFASLRPDRVAAVDANPDFGDLSTRTARHPYGLTLRDLSAAQHPLDSFSSVHAYMTVNAADLAVIASPWNTDTSEALSGDEYTAGARMLQRHFNLLLVDCGTGLLDSVTETVLESSDAVLVVTPATVGGVTGAVATLNWLSSHGYDLLIARSVIAIVAHHPSRPTVDVDAIERLFSGAQRPTYRIPFDPHLAEGSEIDLRLLDKETALAFEDLAEGLAEYFPRYDIDPADTGGPL